MLNPLKLGDVAFDNLYDIVIIFEHDSNLYPPLIVFEPQYFTSSQDDENSTKLFSQLIKKLRIVIK